MVKCIAVYRDVSSSLDHVLVTTNSVLDGSSNRKAVDGPTSTMSLSSSILCKVPELCFAAESWAMPISSLNGANHGEIFGQARAG